MVVQSPKNKTEFDRLITDAGSRLVVIDFYATWCGPCRIMAPKFDKFADEFVDSVIFIKIDVDELEDIVENYDVKVMPTFVLIKNGKLVANVEGNVPDHLRDAIEKHK